jgi:plastocyanin
MRHTVLLVALMALSSGGHAGNLTVSVLDKEGKPTPDAVVVLMPAGRKPGDPWPPGAVASLLKTATILQQKMQFVPAVTVVPVGSRLTFVNNDPWEHHVRGSASGMTQFNAPASGAGGFEFRLEGKPEGKPGKSAEVTVGQPGAVLLGCHLHGSMRGHLYVAESPWTQKTGDDGLATFVDVPDGATQVKVWHGLQFIDLPPQTVTVGANPGQITMQLQVVPRRRRM